MEFLSQTVKQGDHSAKPLMSKKLEKAEKKRTSDSAIGGAMGGAVNFMMKGSAAAVTSLGSISSTTRMIEMAGAASSGDIGVHIDPVADEPDDSARPYTPRGFVGDSVRDSTDGLAKTQSSSDGKGAMDPATVGKTSVVVICAQRAGDGAYMVHQITGTAVPMDIAQLDEPTHASSVIAQLVCRGYSLSQQSPIGSTEVLFTLIREPASANAVFDKKQQGLRQRRPAPPAPTNEGPSLPAPANGTSFAELASAGAFEQKDNADTVLPPDYLPSPDLPATESSEEELVASKWV